MNAIPRPKGREAIKAWHRQKIIDATIDVIVTHGIAGTTIAKVVDMAGVSMGLVNTHFKSKDMLLAEVLGQMASEYETHWQSLYEHALDDPVARLAAIVRANFDSEVLNQRTLGVWFAFRAQVRSKPEYLELVGTRDNQQQRLTIELFGRINEFTGERHDPIEQARLLAALIEGMWTEYYLYPDDFDPESSLAGIMQFLDTLYPGWFSSPG